MRRFAGLAVVALLVASCGGGGDEQAADDAASGALVGLFQIDPGSCDADGPPKGSYFRMVQPNGSVGSGPFVINGDSPCKDKTVTALAPGDDGGLRTGEYQPNPDPPFDDKGSALASRIAKPQAWFAVSFALSTNERDPQAKADVPPPSVSAKGRSLRADLRAWAASWNGQFFNQGSPKPDGTRPGNTADATGAYDEASGTYTLEWASQIVGGAFNNFTGVWHLEGKFEPRK